MTRHLRFLVAASLIATALLNVGSMLLGPGLPTDPAGRLAALANAGASATASGLMFAFSQLPFAVGMIGLAVWLRPASSKLATTGGNLALLGAFGHAVWAGVMLLELVMAADEPNRAIHAELLADVESSPVFIPFLLFGLAGTVLGVLLISIALWRSRREPRWIAPTLWAFLVVEFVGSNVSDWATYLSGTLYAAALIALAVRLAS